MLSRMIQSGGINRQCRREARSNTLRREERKESNAPGWLVLECNWDGSLKRGKNMFKVVESGSKSRLSQSLFYKVARSQILLRKKGFHFFLIFSSSFYCVPYGPLLPDTTVPANTIYSISFLGNPVQSAAFPIPWDGIWIKTFSISGKPFFFFFPPPTPG